MFKKQRSIFLSFILICMMLVGCSGVMENTNTGGSAKISENIGIGNIPKYSGSPYVAINNNEPDFTEKDMVTNSYETYSELDSLGRCQVAMACVGTDIMPTEERGSISSVKPSGWQSVKYDVVDGKYLYNRCHLIGYQLTGENANKKNLITGTRAMNVDGMLPFENMVADYVKETKNHVIYRVTPMYEGNNLVASGVLVEAKSVEDDGEGVLFNVYVYNVQPGIEINYVTGESSLESQSSKLSSSDKKYILNTSSRKIHLDGCSVLSGTKSSNKEKYSGNIKDLLDDGYQKCNKCNP